MNRPITSPLVTALYVKYGMNKEWPNELVQLLGHGYWYQLHWFIQTDKKLENKVRMLLGPHGETVRKMLEARKGLTKPKRRAQ